MRAVARQFRVSLLTMQIWFPNVVHLLLFVNWEWLARRGRPCPA